MNHKLRKASVAVVALLALGWLSAAPKHGSIEPRALSAQRLAAADPATAGALGLRPAPVLRQERTLGHLQFPFR